MQLQKEVKPNPKQPSCKTVCSPQEGYCVKSKVAAKKWLANSKTFIAIIQVNLVPNPLVVKCGEGNTNSPEFSV